MTAEEVPRSVAKLCADVRQFIDDEVLPVEAELDNVEPGPSSLVRGLSDTARSRGLWALGHPRQLGGGGLPFLDYAFVNEAIGRSQAAQLVLGTVSLRTSIMLPRHASTRRHDEVHITRTARRILARHIGGEAWDFGAQ